MLSNYKNNFEENDKENVNRDKSNNADMKVFHGAINAKNFLEKSLGENVNNNDYKNIFNLGQNNISIFKIN